MKQKFFELRLKTNGQKLYNFTDQTINWIEKNSFNDGILNLSIQHTSASLIVLGETHLNRFKYDPALSLVPDPLAPPKGC